MYTHIPTVLVMHVFVGLQMQSVLQLGRSSAAGCSYRTAGTQQQRRVAICRPQRQQLVVHSKGSNPFEGLFGGGGKGGDADAARRAIEVRGTLNRLCVLCQGGGCIAHVWGSFWACWPQHQVLQVPDRLSICLLCCFTYTEECAVFLTQPGQAAVCMLAPCAKHQTGGYKAARC